MSAGTNPGQSCGGRICGRVCNTMNLDVTFYRNGVPTDPYAVRMIRIYKRSVSETNLVVEIPIAEPGSSDYPAPLQHNIMKPGYFIYPFQVPKDFPVPDIFFDVWYFIPDSGNTECSWSGDVDDETQWLKQCARFWVYSDGWYVNDNLMTPRLGFEPLDVNFRAGESRFLEVGMTPLPLYDFDYNLITPLLPCLQASITVKTRNCEIVVDNEPMCIGLRQGSYRTNPFVLKYMLDTSKFLIGTYDYSVSVIMPDGQKLVSPKFTFTISN